MVVTCRLTSKPSQGLQMYNWLQELGARVQSIQELLSACVDKVTRWQNAD